MRAGRTIAAAAVLVALLGGCSSTGSVPSTASASTVTDVPCPTDARTVPAPEPLPAGLTISHLLLCQVSLVDRGSQGWWLQLTQRDAGGDLSGYLLAVHASPPPMTRCGFQMQRPATVPELALDSSGVLHRLRLPSSCTGSAPEVLAAAARLHWQPATTRWLNRVVPAALRPGDCSAFLRENLSRYWPLESHDGTDAAAPRYLNAVTYYRDQVCAVRSPSATGPVADDVVVARRITSAGQAAEAVLALDAHPGITGPDPIGWRAAPAGTGPTPGPCTRPTRHPYAVMTGEGALGYADVGACLKAAATGTGTSTAQLLDIVEQLQTSPYET